MDRPTHDLFVWLQDAFPLSEKEGEVDFEAAARACKKLGRKTSGDTLKGIARGWFGCSYKFSKFLSEKLTRGQVSIKSIMEYPYNRQRPRAA